MNPARATGGRIYSATPIPGDKAIFELGAMRPAIHVGQR